MYCLQNAQNVNNLQLILMKIKLHTTDLRRALLHFFSDKEEFFQYLRLRLDK